MKFLSELDVRLVDGAEQWVLLSPLIYRSKYSNDLIIVPKGFKTDFASVPRLPVIYSLAGDRAHAPAVVHDFCYRYKLFKRELCDKIFLEAMEDIKLNFFIREMMYLGVRLGGGFNYDNKTEYH